MYLKAIKELQDHCKGCRIGQAIDLLMELVPSSDLPNSEPAKPEQVRAKPVKAAATKPDPNGIERECHKCHTVKPLADYDINSQCRDGHVGTCKSCVRDRQSVARALRKGKQPTPSVKPHACKVCGVRFNALNSLDEHMKLRHPA